MSIDFDDRRDDPRDGQALEELAGRVTRAALAAEGVTPRVNIGLTLVEPCQMRQINQEFRRIDQETDVLSFPMIDYDLRADAANPGDIDPDTGELVLGDIVICVKRAAEQALEYGHSFEREFGFLVAHGMLHLLGYDHEGEEDTPVMRAMEEKVLAELSLTREKGEVNP